MRLKENRTIASTVLYYLPFVHAVELHMALQYTYLYCTRVWVSWLPCLSFKGARAAAQEEVADCGRLLLRRKRSWRNQTHGGQSLTVIPRHIAFRSMKHFDHSHKVTSLPLCLTHESPWSCLDVKWFEQRILNHLFLYNLSSKKRTEIPQRLNPRQQEVTHFRQLLCCKLASCLEKLLTSSLFSGATSLSSYTGSRRREWLTDRPGRCPRQSTDAFDMTGPAISSLAVRAWLDQVIAGVKDWVLLSTWHIHLTHLSSPPPPSQLPNLGSPFVISLLRRESRFKGELPSSSLLPPRCCTPYCFSAPRKLVALQGFPSILRELLPLDFFPMSVGKLQAQLSSRSLLPVAGWFPPTGPSPLLRLPPCGWRTRCLLRSTCPLLRIHI